VLDHFLVQGAVFLCRWFPAVFILALMGFWRSLLLPENKIFLWQNLFAERQPQVQVGQLAIFVLIKPIEKI
jgi:hypothetical protein